ncbi:hypothetical protein FACS1894188_11160 [Clostridia bacterium]|nr:hypothetical protein FACS1894188_11160 [Clostridia bacterium]
MNLKRQTGKMTVLYERLSRDDILQGESLSIANQKQILETYAEQNGYKPYLHLSEIITTRLIQLYFSYSKVKLAENRINKGLSWF